MKLGDREEHQHRILESVIALQISGELQINLPATGAAALALWEISDDVMRVWQQLKTATLDAPSCIDASLQGLHWLALLPGGELPAEQPPREVIVALPSEPEATDETAATATHLCVTPVAESTVAEATAMDSVLDASPSIPATPLTLEERWLKLHDALNLIFFQRERLKTKEEKLLAVFQNHLKSSETAAHEMTENITIDYIQQAEDRREANEVVKTWFNVQAARRQTKERKAMQAIHNFQDICAQTTYRLCKEVQRTSVVYGLRKGVLEQEAQEVISALSRFRKASTNRARLFQKKLNTAVTARMAVKHRKEHAGVKNATSP